jgi:hypothetical protein
MLTHLFRWNLQMDLLSPQHLSTPCNTHQTQPRAHTSPSPHSPGAHRGKPGTRQFFVRCATPPPGEISGGGETAAGMEPAECRTDVGWRGPLPGYEAAGGPGQGAAGALLPPDMSTQFDVSPMLPADSCCHSSMWSEKNRFNLQVLTMFIVTLL